MRFILAICLLTSSSIVLAQDTVYVSLTASGLNNGSSWADAFTNIQEAIDSSSLGDEVWVASGVYYPSTDTTGLVPGDSRRKTFHLKNSIQLYGGFIGNEAIRPANPLKSPTVLSGDIGISGDISDNCYHVFTVTNLNQGFTHIEGFYIEKGNNMNASSALQLGAGIYQTKSALVLKKVVIRNNQAVGGGGMYARNSQSTLIDCYIHHNNSIHHGGGLRDQSSKTQLKDCRFESNISSSGAGGYFSSESQVDISYRMFKDNQASYGGGGFVLGSNSLSPSTAYSKLHHVTCVTNIASSGGGGVIGGRFVYLSHVTFANNTAVNSGGGLSIRGHANINNITVHNNYGGGVAIDQNNGGNKIYFHNSTLTSNEGAGGYEVLTNKNDSVYFYNSVINGRVSKDSTATIEFDHCLIPNSKPRGNWDNGIGTDKGGNIDSVPLFFAESKSDYRLWKCSPGVDAGDSTKLALDWLDLNNNTDTTEFISTDIAGFNRVNKGQVDMGAFEYHNIKFFYSDSLYSYSYLDTASSYTWINCNTGVVVSNTKTFQHLGDTSATYSLVINKGGCIDTSECFRVDQNLAIKQVPQVDVGVELFPNPVKDNLFVKQSNYRFDKLAIYNMQGQLIKAFDLGESQEFEVPMDFLQRGIYILHLSGPHHAIHSAKITKL